jgi:hypothetical protein
MDWIGPVQDKDMWRALVNTVLNLWVPQNAGKYLSGYTTSGISSSAHLRGVIIIIIIIIIINGPIALCWALVAAVS